MARKLRYDADSKPFLEGFVETLQSNGYSVQTTATLYQQAQIKERLRKSPSFRQGFVRQAADAIKLKQAGLLPAQPGSLPSGEKWKPMGTVADLSPSQQRALPAYGTSFNGAGSGKRLPAELQTSRSDIMASRNNMRKLEAQLSRLQAKDSYANAGAIAATQHKIYEAQQAQHALYSQARGNFSSFDAQRGQLSSAIEAAKKDNSDIAHQFNQQRARVGTPRGVGFPMHADDHNPYAPWWLPQSLTNFTDAKTGLSSWQRALERRQTDIDALSKQYDSVKNI